MKEILKNAERYSLFRIALMIQTHIEQFTIH